MILWFYAKTLPLMKRWGEPVTAETCDIGWFWFGFVLLNLSWRERSGNQIIVLSYQGRANRCRCCPQVLVTGCMSPNSIREPHQTQPWLPCRKPAPGHVPCVMREDAMGVSRQEPCWQLLLHLCPQHPCLKKGLSFSGLTFLDGKLCCVGSARNCLSHWF